MAIRAVTFDVYSALFDIPSGLARAMGDLFRRRGMAADATAAALAWRQAHQQYLLIANSLDREGASNRAAIKAAARFALRRMPPPLSGRGDAPACRGLGAPPALAEAVDVLREVRRRPVTLATLSNGDRTMQEALMGTIPVRFDRILSTEGGKFKPHPSVYRMALAELGVRAEELLHVAGSPTDAAGATAAGIRTVWINRAGDAVIDSRFAPWRDAADLRIVPDLLPPAA